MKILTVVATLRAFSERHVRKGQVGTVVEQLDRDNVLVEFADSNGEAFSVIPIPVQQLIERGESS